MATSSGFSRTAEYRSPCPGPRPVYDRGPGGTEGETISMATRTDTQAAALPAADSHDMIRVHGARVNNLKDVSLEIPKRRLTVFTGVSGSGKSSLVFGTVAAESQRLINETYSAFVQGFMPTLARPDVDVLDGLTTAILVDQQPMGADPRSTVGTATDANAMLRILFSRLGQPYVGPPQAFSFNVASISGAGAVRLERAGKIVKERRSFSITGGMCPRCEGRGSVTDMDLTQLYDDSKSLHEGALTIPGYTPGGWGYRLYSESGFYPPGKPIRDFTKKELNDFLYHEPVRMKIGGINQTYEGLVLRLQRSMLSKDKEGMQPHIRAFVDRAVTFTTCPDCGGTRLAEHARAAKINGISIADACAMQISDLAGWVRDLDEPSVAPLLGALRETLDSFADRPGLPLARPAVGHPVGRRGAAHQDDPPPRLVAHRRHLRLRRTHHRPAPARHPADERPAAPVARQGQHRARGGAQAGGDRHRRPRRRPRPRGRHQGRRGDVRGQRRGPAGQRHRHRAAPGRPRHAEAVGARAVGDAGGARGQHPQPARRRRGHPARRAGRRHRGRGLGQELADRRLGVRPGWRGSDRPGRDPRLAAEQPGDLHRPARPDPQGVREGQRREAGPVQRQLRGRLPQLQRRRRHLHRPGHDGRRRHHLRGMRGQAVRG